MASLIIKVCGMTEAENIRNVEQLDVDMIGFIFYPKSPRCLCEMPAYLPVHAKRVGVFVNENKDDILMYTDRFALDYIQLHGNESPEYCRSLCNNGLHLIKAFSIAHPKDLAAVSAYKGLCDYYLFDTKTPQYGGSGNQFDWNLLLRYTGMTPFLAQRAASTLTASKQSGSSITPNWPASTSTAASKRLRAKKTWNASENSFRK